jgi:hypothetical protein
MLKENVNIYRGTRTFTCHSKQEFQGYVLFNEGSVTDINTDGRLYVYRHISCQQAESQNFCMALVYIYTMHFVAKRNITSNNDYSSSKPNLRNLIKRTGLIKQSREVRRLGWC